MRAEELVRARLASVVGLASKKQRTVFAGLARRLVLRIQKLAELEKRSPPRQATRLAAMRVQLEQQLKVLAQAYGPASTALVETERNLLGMVQELTKEKTS
ncbi:MAG TPA: hypothetical protein VF017_02705 [Thermoanaerobaculia bacterium]|nr:hypothetical protein [Thermoanaerobaculia bacterium]